MKKHGNALNDLFVSQLRALVRQHAGEIQQKTGVIMRKHVRNGNAVKLGRTQEAIAKGETGDVVEYLGTDLGEESTGVHFDCKNLYADLLADRWVHFVRCGTVYYLIAGECE
jgi:hypothetical protein